MTKASTGKRSDQTSYLKSFTQRPLSRAIAFAVAALVGSGVLWAVDQSRPGALPDLFGIAVRPLPPGALQVDDLAHNTQSYQGIILLRGVTAHAEPGNPIITVIDSREARVCADLHCAKYYLPIKISGDAPKPWDELNVRGKIVLGERYDYLEAESVENLGSIKKRP